MIAEPLAAAACVRLERPVRLALTRIEDFAASNPAPGEVIELEAGATAEGDLTGVRGRIVLDRGSNDEFGFEALAALLASGPYRWQARDIASYGVLTNRVGFGAYRAPSAPPAAFAIETLVDELRLRARARPDRAAAAQRAARGRPGARRQALPGLRRRRVPRAPARAPAVGAPRLAARGRGRRRRDRLVARRARARGRELSPGLRRQADDRHRRGRHERDGDRVPVDRRRGLRPVARVGPRRGRRHVRRAVRRAERRQQGHLHRRARRPARGRAGARAAARGGRHRARDRPRGPRGGRRRRASRSARPTARMDDRRARLQGAAASAAPTRRSRATAAPRRPAARRAPPPTCPTSASTARPAR